MTTTYLSFASIAKLHNNQNATVSPIGELSLNSKTFEKDPAVYSVTGSSEIVLYNFLSRNDSATITLSQALAERQIQIADWLYQQALAGNITDSSTATLNALKATFTDAIEFEDVGEMATNNSIYLPSVVRGFHVVTTTVNNVTTTDKQEFYLWFADSYFNVQYTHATYGIVHPVPLTEIDSLYEMNYQQLEARLALETPDVIVDRETAITDGAAYTSRKVSKFAILDLINTPNSVFGFWRILTNGNYNEDDALDQTRTEILANSKYTEAQWGEKIPDLFNPNEYYVIPRYDRLGLVNKTNNTSGLSPIVDFETELDFVNVYLTPNMSSDHVIKSTQSVPMEYKSFQATVTAKANNRTGFLKIYDSYPDYSLIPSTDSDYGLISASTRGFIETLSLLVSAAEVTTEFSIPKPGTALVKRFDKLWVTAKVNGMRFMVMIRSQMVDDGLVEA